MDNRVWVWGLPIAPMTRTQAVEAVVELVEVGQPSFFITANTHYAMLTHEDPGLQAVNAQAAFVLADGAPLVWASRWKRSPLPERVAGSDLIFDLCGRAARDGYRIFLLGGAAGVAGEAAEALTRRFPGLCIVGTESPPFRELSAEEHGALVDRIRAARPDILFVAFGQPKGESWIAAPSAVARRPGLRPGRRVARLRRRSGAPGPALAPEARPGMGLPDVARAGSAGAALCPQRAVPPG